MVAALAESKSIAGHWLRSGNTACVNGAAEFLRQTVATLPSHIRVGLARADSGFGDESFLGAAESLGLKFIVVARLAQTLQTLCRHAGELRQKTGIEGWEVQEAPCEAVGRRLILIRQRIAERPPGRRQAVAEGAGWPPAHSGRPRPCITWSSPPTTFACCSNENLAKWKNPS